MRQVNMFQTSIIINIIVMGRMMSTSTKGLLIEFHLQRWDHKYVKHGHRNTTNFPTNIHRTGSERVTGLLTYKMTSTTHHFPPKSNPINRTGPLNAFENILRLEITVTRADQDKWSVPLICCSEHSSTRDYIRTLVRTRYVSWRGCGKGPQQAL